MKRFVLKNGLTVITKKKPTDSVAIEVTVKVGSNQEHSKLRGISHFTEHMLFEGTKNRSTHQIANEIESIGGEINALTANERTSYYVIVLSKYFDRALDILSDIIQYPLFDEKAIEKERKVILDEINLTIDDPKIYQWVLFQKLMYRKHPCRNPIYGDKNSVLNLKRKDFLDFYSKYYAPNNIIVSVVGNFDKKVLKKIKNKFLFSRKPLDSNKIIVEPKQSRSKEFIEKRKILQSYMVFGYRAVPRMHSDSFVFEVIRSILGRGQSSKLFDEIRTKRGLAYNLGVHYEASTDYGWFAIYVGTDKKNIRKIKKIITDEICNLKKLSDKDLKDAINFIEGDYLLSNEDNHTLNDTISFWETLGDVKLVEEYIKKIKRVKKKDVARVVNKYFKNFVNVIIKQN